ncbi:MAG TPA: hypothetical protein VGD65_24805 [Chryseosolibacter sp.]
MDLDFHHFPHTMDSRERIRAMKTLQGLHPVLQEILASELKAGSIIRRVDAFGDGEIQAVLDRPFHKSYENEGLEHRIETDYHYRGDYYRTGNHSLIASLAEDGAGV